MIASLVFASAMFVSQPDPTATLVGTEVWLQAGLDRQGAKQNGLAALVAQTVLETPVEGGQRLEDAVASRGGSISYTMDPQDVRFYLEGLPGAYPDLLRLFGSALAKPDLGPATIAVARDALDAKIAQAQQRPLSVAIAMLNNAFYQGSGAGMAPYGLPATLAQFASSDVRAFFAAHYRRGDAAVSAVGDTAAVPAEAFAAVTAGLPAGMSPSTSFNEARISSLSHQLIARRDVPVPWLVAQYPAPPASSRDFGAMLILTAFLQRTLADVASIPQISTQSALSQGVGAYYNFDANPANVVIYVDGGLGDPSRTFATALTVVNVLGHAKLGGDLKDMKTFAAGRLLEGMASLQDRAWIAGVLAQSGVRGDYLSSALKAIDATTAPDLQRVASQYLSSPTIALVLPRAR